MMKKVTMLSFFLICSFFGRTQKDSSFSLIKKIKGDITKFTVDQLDNIYLLNSTDQLKKIDANGDSVGIFNNIRRHGKVSYIDVSNPMRVLLYYKDFATVVILDRLLNIRTTIDLRHQNILQVRAVGLSYDNKIWLYDEWDNKLKKIDEDGKLLFETADFRQLFSDAYSFTSIFDKDGFLYLYDEQKGVLVFDYYGSLKRKIPFTGMKNFKATGKYFFGIKNDSLFRYQTDILFSKEMPLPTGLRQATSIHFNSNFVYALKNDGLEIYLLK